MATLKIQQKEKLVEMLKEHYELDNEVGIHNFIEIIVSDCTDKVDARLELTLIAYALIGKERMSNSEIDSNAKQICIHFNPYPAKLLVVKALKELHELNLNLKEAKEIVDSEAIVVNISLLEKVRAAIIDCGGTIKRVQIL